MSILREDNRKQNEAITKKVNSILNNAKYIQNFNITIHGSREEMTTIYYRIEEVIVPDQEAKNDESREVR